MAGKTVKAPTSLDGIVGKLKKAVGSIFTSNPGAKAGKKVGAKAADLLINMHKKGK